MKNKNIPTLAKAIRDIDCKMRIIGRLDAVQAAMLEENKIEFEIAYDLSDEQMRNEYRRADIVAFCSTYEGFGLPIIEAQAMRKPLITSNISPMKETSGGAAFLADPHDVESIRQGIQKIISDKNYRDKLIEAGIENIRRFEPDKVAKQYAVLYEKILSSESACQEIRT